MDRVQLFSEVKGRARTTNFLLCDQNTIAFVVSGLHLQKKLDACTLRETYTLCTLKQINYRLPLHHIAHSGPSPLYLRLVLFALHLVNPVTYLGILLHFPPTSILGRPVLVYPSHELKFFNCRHGNL